MADRILRQKGPVRRPSRAQLRAVIAKSPIEEIRKVRPQMVQMGQKLMQRDGYPSEKVVDRLAQLLANRLLAERN